MKNPQPNYFAFVLKNTIIFTYIQVKNHKGIGVLHYIRVLKTVKMALALFIALKYI